MSISVLFFEVSLMFEHILLEEICIGETHHVKWLGRRGVDEIEISYVEAFGVGAKELGDAEEGILDVRTYFYFQKQPFYQIETGFNGSFPVAAGGMGVVWLEDTDHVFIFS